MEQSSEVHGVPTDASMALELEEVRKLRFEYDIGLVLLAVAAICYLLSFAISAMSFAEWVATGGISAAGPIASFYLYVAAIVLFPAGVVVVLLVVRTTMSRMHAFAELVLSLQGRAR